MTTAELSSFAFRPWVRSTCRSAIIWGVGVLAILASVAWYFRSPDEGAFGWAFMVLAGYSLLFLLSLLKIWWTAGSPAVEIDATAMSYQPLHTFRPRRIAFDRILACGPRPGTESLRFVVEGPRRDKEFFFNLAVVRNKHRLMEALEERFLATGMEPVAPDRPGWRRPGFDDQPAAEAAGSSAD